jgi:hypothetical protein
MGIVTLGLLAWGIEGVPGAADGPAAKGPAWLSDYAAAREAARRSGKPILAVFR